MTDDLDSGPVKIVTNPLHSMAEDAFLTLERTIEDGSTLDPFEVHPNAGAHSWRLCNKFVYTCII